jgi:FKBP-type peptidyl-prolyl cis-trans isomerase FkpA
VINVVMNRLIILFLIFVALISCKDNDDPNASYNAELKKIDDRLTQLGVSDNVLYTANGARIVINNPGTGAPPHSGQKVIATVNGELFSDGSTFTSSPINTKLEDITPAGLSFCMGLLMKGTSATIYLPSKSGFGSAGATGVPPNSILVYDVLLENIERTASEQTQFQNDTAAIHQYLIGNSINATGLPSGIWYTVDAPGTGSGVAPTPYSVVTFAYKLKQLTQPGTVLQQGTIPNQQIFGLIDGLKIGMPLMTVGSRYTFYVPSGLAYGPTGSSGIAANSNLIFEITLDAVSQ